MRYSQFYIRTIRNVAKQDSANAYLLTKAGYVNQLAAGVYTLLPLGLRVIEKIEAVIREEMAAIGASELLMPSLLPKTLLEATKRDKSLDPILYKDVDGQMVLAPTHEETLTSLLTQTISSYKDLPIKLFQIQTKFRKEPRAKSGLLRGREFLMKDLYSFHTDQKDHDAFYQQVADAYTKIFERLGLESYRIKASGGVFSDEFSDEFQVLCQTGEDEIHYNAKTRTGFNQEVIDKIPDNQKNNLKSAKAIEVGNIFRLGTTFSSALKLNYQTADGKVKPVVMGSYGIGITRLLGTLAEVYNDEHGLKLPKQVAPFDVYLIDLTSENLGQKLEKELEEAGLEVLSDDRDEMAGVKMVEADLIGLPIRLVISHKTAQEGKVEVKYRAIGEIKLVDRDRVIESLG
jgi:prolyl-tRNA synthetase